MNRPPTLRSLALGIETLSDWINHATLILGALFLILMALHVTLDVALRYFVGRSFPGTLEIVSFYYMVALVFLPLAYTERMGEHINVDVLVGRFPPSVQLALYLFAGTLGVIYFAMLGYQGYLDALEATASQETAMANFTFYLWPSRWALPLGFGAICLAIVANMLKAIRLRQAL
ncbi:TRAP transporter small permease [Halomonas elongata]|uniref:TRAP transporter small permease n=1 Tax=Halomonas elongata TaxID=2746 RepID=UPI002E293A1A|nr:TRAP transporter small permease [Halomonas elongata]WVI70240.1 TRAP transporter small permease [Halomonas elongata]